VAVLGRKKRLEHIFVCYCSSIFKGELCFAVTNLEKQVGLRGSQAVLALSQATPL